VIRGDHNADGQMLVNCSNTPVPKRSADASPLTT
jgi:hypothetical protein